MTNLLVAVDGSEANQAALNWAITEAERTDLPLSIAVIAEPWQVPGSPPPDVSDKDYVQPIVDRATEVATARLDADRVETVVSRGNAAIHLVDLAEHYSGLVVGSRGMGAIRRVLLGSTSLAVAGRSPIPVTVVPDTWDDADASGRPVLLGLDMEEQHDAAVRYAFAEAKGRGVALQVLQGWQPPPVLGVMAGDQAAYYVGWQAVCLNALMVYIDRMGQEFPEVEVRVNQETGHPVDLLVDGAAKAQLLVLGRDEKERWTGFALGSVARSVLPHCAVPVAVVPAC